MNYSDRSLEVPQNFVEKPGNLQEAIARFLVHGSLIQNRRASTRKVGQNRQSGPL